MNRDKAFGAVDRYEKLIRACGPPITSAIASARLFPLLAWIALSTYFVVVVVLCCLFVGNLPYGIILVAGAAAFALVVLRNATVAAVGVLLASTLLAAGCSLTFEESGRFPFPVTIAAAASERLRDVLSGEPDCFPCSEGCCPRERFEADLTAPLAIQWVLWVGWAVCVVALRKMRGKQARGEPSGRNVQTGHEV